MVTKKEQLKKALVKKPYSFPMIKKDLGITKKQAMTFMDEMKTGGVPIKSDLNDKYQPFFYVQLGPSLANVHDLNLKDGEYVMGVNSDIHVGDAAFHEVELNRFYDENDNAGSEFILCAGDIVTGVDVYRSQHADLSIHTKMAQTQYVIDNLPTLADGKITHFITGNHDLKNMAKSFDPGPIIENKKPGWHYLGQYLADVNIAGGLCASINHLSGHPYSLSYRAQKYLRELNVKDNSVPDILILGHAHKLLYAMMQGVHVLEAGAWQGENTFTKHRGLETQIAGWIVYYEIENGELTKLTPELHIYR